jgi:hypothetical protein
VERPKTLTARRAILRPRPDFTTLFATRNAVMTRSTLPLLNPANALAGVSVPERTTAAAARSAEVSSGNAPRMTEQIAAAKIANRCQAAGVSPPGTGAAQIPAPRKKGMTRRRRPRRREPALAGAGGRGEAGCTARALIACPPPAR